MTTTTMQLDTNIMELLKEAEKLVLSFDTFKLFDSKGSIPSHFIEFQQNMQALGTSLYNNYVSNKKEMDVTSGKVKSRAPLASPEKIKAFKMTFAPTTIQTGTSLAQPEEDWVSKLEALTANSKAAFYDKLDTIQYLIDNISQLATLNENHRVLLIESLCASIRQLQDEEPYLMSVGGYTKAENLVGDMFRKIKNFIDKKYFIHGLQHSNKSQHCSGWNSDAQHKLKAYFQLKYGTPEQQPKLTSGEASQRVEDLLDKDYPLVTLQDKLVKLVNKGLKSNTRVLNLLSCYQDDLSRSELKPLAKAIRKHNKRCNDDATKEPFILDNWSDISKVQNKRAMVLGSCGRTLSRLAPLKFATVDHYGPKDTRRLKQSIKARCQDEETVIFLMTHCISHKVSDLVQAARVDDGAKIVYVNSGYGLNAFVRAIEESY